MFTERDLRELLEFHPRQPVLSVYLNTDPAEGSADVYKLRLRSMLKDVELEKDGSAVERYIEHEHIWSGKGLAVFSCQPENYFKTYTFATPLRDRVRISDRPHVKPLADLLDSYGGYGVALVDKQGGRLYNFHLGELRAQEEYLGEAVRRTKRGGGSQAAGRRGGTAGQTNYIEEVTERNLRDAAELAARFFAEHNVRRILIGGTEDNVALFRSQLPKAWQSLVVGSFPISMNANQSEVLERALEIGRQAERRRETRFVKSVITNAAKGRGGTTSLDDTLSAVHEGRVQTLVIREGYRSPGYRCVGCGFLTAHPLESCPFCGSQFSQISDAVELAVRRVMQDGGEVEVVHDFDEIREFGGIGALLRY